MLHSTYLSSCELLNHPSRLLGGLGAPFTVVIATMHLLAGSYDATTLCHLTVEHLLAKGSHLLQYVGTTPLASFLNSSELSFATLPVYLIPLRGISHDDCACVINLHSIGGEVVQRLSPFAHLHVLIFAGER